MIGPDMPQWHVLVVDETQVLPNKLTTFFLSSDGKKERSAFSAVLTGFEKLALSCYNKNGHPVFAGTGMSMDDFEDTTNSIIAKGIGSPGPFSIFKNFAPFEEKNVKEYLYSVLDLEEKDIDEAVLRHLCKWLRGRPRWTASFLEAYLVRKTRESCKGTRGSFSPSSAKLLEALDQYRAVYTKDPETTDDRRGSFTPEKGSPFKAMRDAFVRYAEEDLIGTLQRAVFKFAVGGEEVIIEENDMRLIEVGLVAIRVDERGSRTVLDEPIMVEAGINYFSLKGSALTNLLAQEKGGQGEAFEKIMLPAIQDNFAKVLEKQHKEENQVLSQYRVSTKSAYGVLAASCKMDIGRQSTG
ncbi:expressed unknown protein [Seminavis robusta]|uniref:Uncharacterized protein n=1 Tax=Seminavis robusta TaxID=568900 RepID=A0A9N8HN51_9STRA|nr:expressed unknown protein [Seminavis robusta]|eukprot:Sro961_g225020.1 n/a (354) ;mRNA; f:30570-31631